MNATASSSGPEAQAGRPARAQVRSADGLGLVAFRWQGWAAADGGRQAPRATVALLHGLAEHARRYDALAARLAAAGIELVAIDLRGHGCSPGRRTWVDRFDQYLDDADALASFARREGVPLFLMGHSMGGAIAALYAIERAPARGQPFAGLVLSSPALAPGRDVPRWMLAASRIMSRAWPRFPALKIDAALLSRDPEVVAANRADPLVQHGAVPARTGAEILVAMERIARGRASLALPTLIYHGTADKLTEPEGSREFGAQAGPADKTLTLYEGNYHETMNDLERERVIGELIDWIVARS